MENIKLDLSIKETNIILNALSSRPYVEVCDLISKIQTEGNKQLETKPVEEV